MTQLQDLYSRNWLFIPEAIQKKLHDTCIFLAGSGLGSVIAEIAVRTGFGRFVIADGDTVEMSNLNRQAFNTHSLGQNKAEETRKLIHAINPSTSVTVIKSFLTPDCLDDPINQSDIIINTIDFNSPAFLDCNEKARESGKTVLFPMNIGWGGALFVFTPQSATLNETIGLMPEVAYSLEDIKKALVCTATGSRTPPYLKEKIEQLKNATPETWPYDPQLCVAAAVTASLVVTTAVALVADENVVVTPDVVHVDLYANIIHPLSQQGKKPWILGR